MPISFLDVKYITPEHDMLSFERTDGTNRIVARSTEPDLWDSILRSVEGVEPYSPPPPPPLDVVRGMATATVNKLAVQHLQQFVTRGREAVYAWKESEAAAALREKGAVTAARFPFLAAGAAGDTAAELIAEARRVIARRDECAAAELGVERLRMTAKRGIEAAGDGASVETAVEAFKAGLPLIGV